MKERKEPSSTSHGSTASASHLCMPAWADTKCSCMTSHSTESQSLQSFHRLAPLFLAASSGKLGNHRDRCTPHLINGIVSPELRTLDQRENDCLLLPDQALTHRCKAELRRGREPGAPPDAERKEQEDQAALWHLLQRKRRRKKNQRAIQSGMGYG